MTKPNSDTPRGKRRFPGADWLLAMAGILALLASVKHFVEADMPEIAQSRPDNSSAS